MVPSPRKRAPRAPFDQTWDDADTAFLDPGSLPVARIPRGWERKQETKRTEEGREKKIWRRFGLRSRAADTTEADDDEEHDARSRAVKKRQHLSPKAMEKTTSKTNGKKRAFKTTRWDRRKSVLPRKNTAQLENSMTDLQDELHDSEDAQDATGEDLTEESFADSEPAAAPRLDRTPSELPYGEERRSTFTFTMEAATVEDLPDYESLDGLGDYDAQGTEDDAPVDDATIVRLLQSPAKGAAQTTESIEEIRYPDLPQSDNDAVESETISRPIVTAEPTLLQHIDDYLHDAEAADMNTEESEETVNEQKVLSKDIEHEEVKSTGQDAIDTQAATDSVSELHALESPSTGLSTASSDITYPALPIVSSPRNCDEIETRSSLERPHELVEENPEMCEILDHPMDHSEHINSDVNHGTVLEVGDEENADEEFTEASLQLNILRDYQAILDGEQSSPREPAQDDSRMSALQDEQVVDVTEAMDEDIQPVPAPNPSEQSPVEVETTDITDGLTLSLTPAKLSSITPTPRKLHSPPPPPVQSGLDDATMTIALDDDTAILKGFLNRVAASKAEKAAVTTHRRESLQNRRDSDVIRHALASPRKALEDKDPNSPSKYDNELTLDLSQTLTLSMPDNALAASKTDYMDFEDSPADEESLRGSRRSSRAKKSRLPAPASAGQAQVQASKIAIRRADGTEHVVLKKSDAQELSLITRTNTRKNKQGAFCVTVRLMKLAVDAAHLPPLDDSTKELVIGKNIRWDEQLAYYQENPETIAEAESVSTPDELGMPDAACTPSSKPKSKVSKNSTPKIRRVRGLGSTNGTPGKVLLAPTSFLAEPVEEQKEAAPAPAATQQLLRPEGSKMKKMAVAPVSTPSDSKLPTLDIAPVGIEPTKERKSRLAAPKKVMLPQPVTALPAEGKENTQRTGISGATPKKGIPAPKVTMPPSVGMESGLPRRRGRKM